MKYLKNVATIKYNPGKCSGCGRCVEVCPHEVFIMKDKIAGLGNIDMCMECGACEKNCAFGAISVNSGVGCANALIKGMLTGGEPECGCSPQSSGTCC